MLLGPPRLTPYRALKCTSVDLLESTWVPYMRRVVGARSAALLVLTSSAWPSVTFFRAPHKKTLRAHDSQRMPPFTREVQEWIWHRQNPPRENCSTSKYLLVDNIVQQVCARRIQVQARLRTVLHPVAEVSKYSQVDRRSLCSWWSSS